MKSQIQKKKKKNGGIMELLIQYQHFSKKASHEGAKTFGKKIMGRLF